MAEGERGVHSRRLSHGGTVVGPSEARTRHCSRRAVLAISAGLASAALMEGPDNPLQKHDRVLLCHSTGESGFVMPGSGAGGVPVTQIFAENGHHTHPNDIIPSFWYLDEDGHRHHYPVRTGRRKTRRSGRTAAGRRKARTCLWSCV